MSVHFLAGENLYKNFKEEQTVNRPGLVADVLFSSRDSFRFIIQVASTRSIDEGAFLQGLLVTLKQDPENLPALRLLAWHQLRTGDMHAAKRTLRLLITHWPNISDTRRELTRISMMAPDSDGDEIFKLEASELQTPLTRSSYDCQYSLARTQSVPSVKAVELQLNIDHFCAEIFRTSAAPDPILPEQRYGVFLDILTKIIAAKSIALVANGPSLTNSKSGEKIDSHDIVIRCNFPVFSRFSEDVGRKVDIVFFNESLTNMLPGLMAREAAYKDSLALALHPGPAPLFSAACYARNMTDRMSKIQPKLQEFYRNFFYTRPTTGLMGIILISVVLGKNLKIYGFDFYNQSKAHYFPSSEPVFLGHELQYERWFLEQFLAWLIPGKVVAAERFAQPNSVHRYDMANMADPPEASGVLKILEAPKQIPRRVPEFVADLSGKRLELKTPPQQEIHGSYLVRRENVLLFGPNNLVTPEGYWSCEARTFKRQFLWYFHLPFYDRMFPGPKPAIDYKTENLLLRTDNLKDTDVERVDIPVFLATPLEPPIWGRWIVTVAQKVMQYKEYGAGRKFLCHAVHDWQRAFLRLLGVEEDMILAHDPGRTYVCRDLMTVEYSVTNMTVSAMERANFFTMIANHRVKIERKRKIFVSRLSRSRHNPNYRVLQNEVELASMLEELGFTTIEPETLPFEEQISIFAAAEQVVFLGGSGVFNAAFCAPGTSVVTIESSDTYIGHHTELLASLDMRYGVIFGKEDPEDRSDSHKRWTVDVARVRDELMKFFGAG